MRWWACGQSARLQLQVQTKRVIKPAISSAGTRPRTGPIRSIAIESTCSAWAFESFRKQVDGPDNST